MTDVHNLITDNIDVWTSAIKKRNAVGRGSSKKIELNGIKKLRELILELAVRGKLVPQDVNDEPVSVLLARIAKVKAQLIADKKIKKQKTLPAIIDDVKLCDLPNEWEWCNLVELITLMDAGWSPACPPEPSPSDDKWGVLKTTAVQSMQFLEYENKVLAESKEPRPQYEVKVGDILITRAGPKNRVGVSCLVQSTRPKLMISDKIIRFHLAEVGMYARYISLCLNAGATAEYLESAKSGMASSQMNISQDKLKAAPIPLCPINEQHRIVTKVDELMALCDQLEQQTEQSLAAHQTLIEVLLAALTKSDSTEDFQTSWQRIAEHFDVLFTTEHSIEQLKQTILQLAVMGKLVPQNPSDEPVDKLLARIASHRDERVKNKEMQKFKLVKPIDDPNSEVPLSWKSILLNDLVFVTKLAGFEYTKHIDLKDSGEVPVIRAQNVRPFRPDLRNLKYIDEETSMALPRSALDRAALLITFIGAGIGDVCLLNENKRFHLAPNVAKVEAFSDLSLQYLSVYLNSPLGKVELFKSMKSTAQPSISMTTLREMWVSLPPLDEQHRIVAKVDELMTLCEQLKARLSDAQTTQLHLADAVVENALSVHATDTA